MFSLWQTLITINRPANHRAVHLVQERMDDSGEASALAFETGFPPYQGTKQGIRAQQRSEEHSICAAVHYSFLKFNL
ncbi:hypothetical protein [Paenibacillus baekrokdamisoli]|uniref:hypothetical protein n=1 Tax=Paenibacillus baekrokdamisoli TaxID=1712516 RepID=UPI001C841FA2|nr:hypothetical protein [Paenibacillus baekrokdamisoli]